MKIQKKCFECGAKTCYIYYKLVRQYRYSNDDFQIRCYSCPKRAIMGYPSSAPHIANNLRGMFSYLCDKKWEELETTKDQTKRYCHDCQRIVRIIRTAREFGLASLQGACIYVERDLQRSVDLMPKIDSSEMKDCRELVLTENLLSLIYKLEKEEEDKHIAIECLLFGEQIPIFYNILLQKIEKGRFVENYRHVNESDFLRFRHLEFSLHLKNKFDVVLCPIEWEYKSPKLTTPPKLKNNEIIIALHMYNFDDLKNIKLDVL